MARCVVAFLNLVRRNDFMRKSKLLYLKVWILLLCLFSGCSYQTEDYNTPVESVIETSENQTNTNRSKVVPNNNQSTGLLNIYFVDAGQADACLLEYNGDFGLIDAGDNDDEKTIVQFLNEKGVSTLDFIIGTHPHADHIGGMDAVINQFDIGDIYMPRVQNNTKTFEDVLTAIEAKGLSITSPIAGNKFSFNGIPITILAPMRTYEDLNNNSIVAKLNFNDFSCIFTGDIEAEAENDILQSGYDVSAKMIKVAHHGSETSSTQAFIDTVNPQYAIVSVGAGNTYGHPDPTIMQRFLNKSITAYRTDECGTIQIKTDGTSIDIITEPHTDGTSINMITEPHTDRTSIDIITEPQTNASEVIQKNENSNPINADNTLVYIGNKNSKKFHLQSCRTLPAEKNQIPFKTREEAIDNGYNPCKNCNP